MKRKEGRAGRDTLDSIYRRCEADLVLALGPRVSVPDGVAQRYPSRLCLSFRLGVLLYSILPALIELVEGNDKWAYVD